MLGLQSCKKVGFLSSPTFLLSFCRDCPYFRPSLFNFKMPLLNGEIFILLPPASFTFQKFSFSLTTQGTEYLLQTGYSFVLPETSFCVNKLFTEQLLCIGRLEFNQELSFFSFALSTQVPTPQPLHNFQQHLLLFPFHTNTTVFNSAGKGLRFLRLFHRFSSQRDQTSFILSGSL